MTKKDLPVGPLASQREAIPPPHTALHGKHTSVVPLSPAHTASLYKHLGGEENSWRWTYMYSPGFPSLQACEADIALWSRDSQRTNYAVLTGPASDPASEAAGILCYLAIVPEHRRLEIGSVILSERLRQTREATEAFYMFIRHAFEDLGYLRVEWKANNLNKPSVEAAKRLGFTFEGVFRKHLIIKGRERDSAWFSITDEEWPAVKKGFERWLDDGNFDGEGRQRRGLKECREGHD